jgi:hypothetical protein
MTGNIISYIDMCQREGLSLQAGMNFGVGGNHSVILMSVRPNAPYRDRVEDEGTTLIYEGHDEPRGPTLPNPKMVDQRPASGATTAFSIWSIRGQNATSAVSSSSSGSRPSKVRRI